MQPMSSDMQGQARRPPFLIVGQSDTPGSVALAAEVDALLRKDTSGFLKSRGRGVLEAMLAGGDGFFVRDGGSGELLAFAGMFDGAGGLVEFGAQVCRLNGFRLQRHLNGLCLARQLQRTGSTKAVFATVMEGNGGSMRNLAACGFVQEPANLGFLAQAGISAAGFRGWTLHRISTRAAILQAARTLTLARCGCLLENGLGHQLSVEWRLHGVAELGHAVRPLIRPGFAVGPGRSAPIDHMVAG
jgi:hypothetical protein